MNRYIYEVNHVADNENGRRCDETLFHLANGYMGVRGCIEELGGARGTYINGFYDILDMNQAEPLYGFINKKQVMVNVLNTQILKFKIDGKLLELKEDMIIDYHMELNMAEGYSYRITKYRLSGDKILEIKAKRIIPFKEKYLILMDYSFITNFKCRFEVIVGIESNVSNSFKANDPRASSIPFKSMVKQRLVEKNSYKILNSFTKNSNLEIAASLRVDSPDGFRVEESVSSTNISYSILYKMEANKSVSLNKRVYLVDSLRFTNVIDSIIKLEEDYGDISSSFLVNIQKQYLDEFWNSVGLRLRGDDTLERAIYYNLFSLKMSSTQDEYAHIGAKGLSGEGYEGHYFWDTEMYVQSFFTFTNPKESKQLLAFRWNTLSKAKDNAKRMGHNKGALYPWRTINGTECSGYFPGGSSQYHINGAIAYAIIQYYQVTKDVVFMLNKGLIMLVEICRLYLDVGNFYENQFMIHDVTGPDEYSAIVSNNYYTNICAKYDFEHLISIANELNYKIDSDEKRLFEKARDLMYLPYDEKLGISKQDENFLEKPFWDFKNTPKENYPLLLHYHPLNLYRHQVCKQADVVLAHCLYPQYSDEKNRERSLDYYAKITTHDSSLSRAIFSIASARLKRSYDALNYFGSSAYLDIEDIQGNSGDGIHTANMGGTYMALIQGFAGLSITDYGISMNPILPDKWESFSFNIKYRDILFAFNISKVNVEIIAKGCHKIKIFNIEFSFKDKGVYNL